MPKAYVIVDINVTDPVQYEQYRALAGPAVEAGGGRFIVRGGATEVLEGDRYAEKRRRAHFLVDTGRGFAAAEAQVADILRALAARPGGRRSRTRP